jgi:hypothetical protein
MKRLLGPSIIIVVLLIFLNKIDGNPAQHLGKYTQHNEVSTYHNPVVTLHSVVLA